MKKFLISLCVLALVITGASTLFAAGIDNLSNMSADFIRTMNRTHSTDVDAVQYNPAGTTALKKGLSIGLNIQQVQKTVTQKVADTDWSYENAGYYGGAKTIYFTGNTSIGNTSAIATGTTLSTDITNAYGEFQSTVPSTIPSLFAVYNTGDFAAFFGFSIPAGGGGLQFDHNSVYMMDFLARIKPYAAIANKQLAPSNADVQVQASSQYYGFTVGGAYNVVKDLVSVAAGGRFIYAQKTSKLNGTVSIIATAPDVANTRDVYAKYDYNIDDFEQYEESKGFGGILGINITPTKESRISFRYETVTRLMFRNNIRRADFSMGNASGNAGVGTISQSSTLFGALVPTFTANDNKTAARDLPAVASVGASYDVTADVKVFGSFTYYFNKDARWQTYENDQMTTDWYKRGNLHLEKKYPNTWDGGLGIEVNATKELKLSLGWLYTQQFQSSTEVGNAAENPSLNSNTLGAGLQFDAGSGLLFSFGVSDTIYQDRISNYYTNKWGKNPSDPGTTGGYGRLDNGDSRSKDVAFSRSAWTFALGVTYNMGI